MIDRELTDELKDVLVECFDDTAKFAKYFFPDRFSAPFSNLHNEIFKLIDGRDKRVVIAAPRGLGKTSIVGLALAAKAILFRQAHFIVYVSNSATSAEAQTENLKRELLSNKMIRRVFGDIRITPNEDLDEQFSRKAWVAYGDCMILPRGSGQQVRGSLFKNYRPDLIIIDDLEDTETIENEIIRKSRKEWFFGDLLKCVSTTSIDWRIVYIDTLKHQDALLQELLDLKAWGSTRLSICDDNYKSLAPSFVSDEQIAEEVEDHRSSGTLDVFYRERRNIAISTEDASFRADYFKYYEESDNWFRDVKLENVVLIDPAKTAKLSSADSAIVGWGFDPVGGRLFVRDIVAGKLHPEQLYDEALKMAVRLNARVVGIEVTSLNEFVTYPFRTAMLQRGANFELIELKARGGSGQYAQGGRGKEGRIAALVPFYRQGQVYHNKACCGMLETQLLGFPRSKRWDVMDAAAYIVEILDMGLRYFDRPEDVSPNGEPWKDNEHEYVDMYGDERLEPLGSWQTM
jgi:hypothetical protein